MRTERLLREGLNALGISASERQIESFMTYLKELKKWRRAYSLTSLRTDEDIIVKHFLDSLLYLKALPEGKPSVADIGSGAGFPGLPLKIIRLDIDMTLIEPSGKKAAFLRHMIRLLRLEGARVVEGRVEDMKGSSFDAAITRALFTLDEFIKKVSHVVKPGGLLIVSKGPKIKEEISNIKADYEVFILCLPVSGAQRNMVVIKNEG